MVRRAGLIGGVLAITAIAIGSRVWAGTKVYIGSRVATSNQVSLGAVDHSMWDRLLQKYVDGDGMVNYRLLHASKSDLRLLEDYLAELSRGSVTKASSKDAKLAFWINAYNAVTIKGILQKYPTPSIRNHTPKLWGYHIWHDLQLHVGNRSYSLHQIEHEMLRTMRDPRIHFAIVCASISCPRLLNEAYSESKLSEQLELNARDFFTRSRNFRYDSAKQRFYFSSILSWFASDFGDSQASQLERIAGWLPTRSAQRAALTNSVSVSYLSYDWKLNEQRRAARSRSK